MATSGTYYAYVHAKPDGTPFYVGKGKGRRAYNFADRRAHHKNISTKYGAANILVGVMECSSEEIAFDLERGLIKCLRGMGVSLVNLTDGGEGVSGRVERPETKAKRKQFRHTEEAKAKMRKPKSPEFCAKMAELAKGRVPSKACRAASKAAATGRTVTHSAETRAKLSASAKARGIPDSVRAAFIAAHKGKPRPQPESVKQKLSQTAKLRGIGADAENIARLAAINAAKRKPVLVVETGEVFSHAAALAKVLGVTVGAVRAGLREGYCVKGVHVRWADGNV